MTNVNVYGSQKRPEGEVEEVRASSAGLTARMGAPSLVLTVLAYLSPLACSAGPVALVIGYGNGIGAPVTFLLAGVVLLIFSAGYTAMVRSLPRPGAFYAYISAGLGKQFGLGAGTLTAAFYIVGAVAFSFFGGVATRSIMASEFGLNVPWWLTAGVFLAVVTYCSYRGMDFNVPILGSILILEVVVVMIFNIATLIKGGPTGYATESFTWHAFTNGPLAVGALFAISIFGGFECTAIYREEARDPARTIPRATYIIVGSLALFYALTAWCLITALGADNAVAAAAGDPAGAFSTALTHSVAQWFAQTAGLMVVTSILASQIAIANASTRYLYSFGVDRVLPKSLGAVHERHKSPHRATMVNGAIVGLIVLTFLLTGTDPLLAWTVLTGVDTVVFELLMLLVSVAVAVYFKRVGRGSESRWGVVVAPIISTICFTWMLIYSVLRLDLLVGSTPTALIPILFAVMAIIGIAGVGLATWLKSRRPLDYARIGRAGEA